MPLVDVHTHTEWSPLDGLSTCKEAAGQAARNGSPAAFITDHGTCAGHPHWQKACDAAGIKPGFGIEAYFRPDRLARPEAGDKAAQAALMRGPHLILLAQTDKGLHDLWAASTESYATGFYGKPRMDWEILEKYGSELIATTSCLGGIISKDLLGGLQTGDFSGALSTLDRLKATFPGRLYLEIQANDLPEQRRLNMLLAEISGAYGLPLVAACDAHYPAEEDARLHKIWMQCQSGKGNDDYWHFSAMLTEARVREMLGYLDPKLVDQAVSSTEEIANRCDARIRGHAEPPVFTHNGRASDDARHLWDLCEGNWHKVPDTREYRDRLEREFELVSSKGLAGCYLIVSDIVSWVRSRNILVGPGRGSAAGSLMSYLLGITSVDPIKAGLLFERFLTPGRAALPDFDLDFPSSRREMIQDYVIQTYGADHVVRVGTAMRYGAKGILNKLFSVFSDRLPEAAQGDALQVSRLIEEAEAGTAGLGLPWDEIMHEQAIQEIAARYKTIFSLAAALHGRLYTYGKHPAGLIISPGKPLAGSMPMRIADTSATDRLLISQWDYRIAEDQGLLKLDLLMIRTLDTLQKACELVSRRTGTMPDPRAWDIEHSDPQVYDAIGRGETLGMFQVETPLCQGYAERMKPRTLGDLSDLTTYIRPGPRNSGAADQYLRRREGLEPVDYPHPLLEEALSRSQGVMLYQEDILTAVRLLAGYDDLEADGVRKILGKKLTDKIAAAGEEFVRRCTERGHDKAQAESLWEKIAEFGKYAFNRCVTGDTRIHLAASSQYSNGTVDVASLYRRIHAEPGDRNECAACGKFGPVSGWKGGVCSACRSWRQKFHGPNRGLYGLSWWADGRIRPARIVDVVAQGRRETWKITLKDGRSITATGNHRHLTDAGYRRVDELMRGDRLIIDGGYEKDRHDPERHRLTRGERQGKGTVSGAFGDANYGFIDGGSAFWTRWKKSNLKLCAQCGTGEGRIECAHLDGDHSNNTGDNLAWLCASCHKAYDYAHNDRRRRWQKGHPTDAVPVKAIEFAGMQETYDVVMAAPHNFVANGIITHNSHGFSYGTLSYWTAFFKVHYPVEFLTAVLSTLDDKDRMATFATEARRIGITVLPPDARSGGAGFTYDGLSIRYGLSSIKGVGKVALAKITAHQPFLSLEDFRQRSDVDAGVLYALARAGALDSLVPSRRGLVQLIEASRDGSAVRCVYKDPSAQGPGGLPCSYNWELEPPPPPRASTRTGRQLKVTVKPPPKKCTVACRRYTPPGPLELDVPDYRPAELFRQEQEIYGCWMSPSLFGQLDQLGEGMRDQARQVALMIQSAPPGTYPVAAIYGGCHTAVTRTGNRMWWVTLVTEVSMLSLACFSPLRDEDPDLPSMLPLLRTGTLVYAEVTKRSYASPGRGIRMGWRLSDIWAVR